MNHTYKPSRGFEALGEDFFDPVRAANFPKAILRYRNQRAAEEIGLGYFKDEAWLSHFCCFEPLPDNMAKPLALRYHGHQFGVYNPDIGDGRGFLFAQLYDQSGRLMDLGTKGSGKTPYSRFGDGRLTLKGAVREVLAAEMLQALGVPTCRILSVVETGEQLVRNDEPSPARSAVMVRLSFGHVRIGMFEYHGDRKANLEALLDYSLRNFYAASEAITWPLMEKVPYFLKRVSERCADLIAGYMVAGFVHGVLNSDNVNISGESFDYGPYRFLPHFDPSFVAAYFDQQGLYAYGRQPAAMAWNLGLLAKQLYPLCPDDKVLNVAMEGFSERLNDALIRRFFARLGFAIPTESEKVIAECFTWLKASQYGFDDFFRHGFLGGEDGNFAALGPDFPAEVKAALRDNARLCEKGEPLPEVALPYARIEQLWEAICKNDDWQPFHTQIAHIRALGQRLKPSLRPSS